jgi:hypothetical protein
LNDLLYLEAACLLKVSLISGALTNQDTVHAFIDQWTSLYHSAYDYFGAIIKPYRDIIHKEVKL